MDYNPYSLIPMLINGKEISGRPFEFDSDVADTNTMLNAFGNIVKPTKVSTTCPDCGQGLEFDVRLDDPPFSASLKMCYNCNIEPEPQVDPFMNPVSDGRIPEHGLDPLLHDPSQQVVDEEDSTVADRFAFADGEKKSPKKTSKKKTAKKSSTAKKVPKKRKKRPSRAKKKKPEPAVGVGGEEMEFDDNDLLEIE